MTECCVMSKANSTPAAARRGPPVPKNSGAKPVCSGCASRVGRDRASMTLARSAGTSSAASMSPLASPAMIRKRWGTMNESGDGGLLDLPGDFEGDIQRQLGGFAADHRRLPGPHAVDETLQLEFERLALLDG